MVLNSKNHPEMSKNLISKKVNLVLSPLSIIFVVQATLLFFFVKQLLQDVQNYYCNNVLDMSLHASHTDTKMSPGVTGCSHSRHVTVM